MTHLDVKGRLRSEVSEGAGNHDSGALVTKNTHQTYKYTQDSQSHTETAALLFTAGGGEAGLQVEERRGYRWQGGGATGGGIRF